MMYLTHIVVFLFGVAYSFGSLCPNDSTILQEHGLRIWCVWIVDVMLNKSSLAEECRRSDGDIYIVEDESVQLYLVNTLGPKLLKKSTIWIDELINIKAIGVFSYTNWDPYSPGIGDCIIAGSPDFLWVRSSCDTHHYGICYRELNCPNDGTYILTDDLCYWTPIEIAISNLNAEIRCNARNATLAVIPGQNVLDALSGNKRFLSAENLWLGLSDKDEEGVYKTKEGVPAPFLHWNVENPDDHLHPDTTDDCVILSPENLQFYMNDVNCHMDAVPLCFKTIYSRDTISSSDQLSTTTDTPFINKTELNSEQKKKSESLETPEPDIPTTTTDTLPDPPRLSTADQENCSCVKNACNMDFLTDNDALTEQLEKLKSENQIDHKNTSAYLRSLASAKDDRPSSQCIGMAAAAILVTVYSLIVIPDIVTLLRVLTTSRK